MKSAKIQSNIVNNSNGIQESDKFNKMINNYFISVVIPLYNEENSINKVLLSIPYIPNYEIIVVNDGSTDNSVQKIESLKMKNLKIISHKKNKGYGAAISTGLKHAKGDIIITLDSDGQHDPQEISNLIIPLINNEADLVIGSRYLGRYYYKLPIYTKMGEFVIGNILWFIYHQRVSNNQNGFRAFKRNLLVIQKEINNPNFSFTTEFLFCAAYHNFKIVEVPMTAYPRDFGFSWIKLSRELKLIGFVVIYYSLKKLGIYLKPISKLFSNG